MVAVTPTPVMTEMLVEQAEKIADVLASYGIFGDTAKESWIDMERKHFVQQVIRNATEPSPFSHMELKYLKSNVFLKVKTRVGQDGVAVISAINAVPRYREDSTRWDFTGLNHAMKMIAPTI